MKNIAFTAEELREYPKLNEIEEGLTVVANEASYYEGLIGVIAEVRYEEDERETENDTILEIVVDFEEVENMDDKYSALNGTSVSQVIMDEESLNFYFNSNLNSLMNAKGELIN